jgi:hypothetical protein
MNRETHAAAWGAAGCLLPARLWKVAFGRDFWTSPEVGHLRSCERCRWRFVEVLKGRLRPLAEVEGQVRARQPGHLPATKEPCNMVILGHLRDIEPNKPWPRLELYFDEKWRRVFPQGKRVGITLVLGEVRWHGTMNSTNPRNPPYLHTRLSRDDAGTTSTCTEVFLALGLAEGARLEFQLEGQAVLRLLSIPNKGQWRPGNELHERSSRNKAAASPRCPPRRNGGVGTGLPTITDLWRSTDPGAWRRALDRYWDFVLPSNLALERALEPLNLERIRQFDAEGWYVFLHDEYFRWKYTDPRRYATTTKHLDGHREERGLEDLDRIRGGLLALTPSDVRVGLEAADEIGGLGTAGASGLLALMYPNIFGTVDQFVVKALRNVHGLPEAEKVCKMNPEDLTVGDGVCLIGIMQRKAADLNRLFGTVDWTPRKIDKVLWTYGRE